MVHGKFRGSPHFVAPVATNRCGTFCSFRYLWIALFVGVPSVWNTNATWSCSTSRRTISTVFGAVAVVERDEVDLAAVDPALVVDLLEVGGQGLADRAVRGGRAAVRVRVADLDLGRRDPRPLRSSRPREEQRSEEHTSELQSH